MIDFCRDTIRITITNVAQPDDVKTFIHHPNICTGKTNFVRSILSTMGKPLLWCYVRSKSTPSVMSIAIPLTGEYSYFAGDGTNEGPFRYIADIFQTVKPDKSEFVIESEIGKDQYVLTAEVIPSEPTTTVAEDTALDTTNPIAAPSQIVVRAEFFGD